MADGMSELAGVIANLDIDTNGLEELELEMDKVEWYTERFNRCMADGVPGAINEYLIKLGKDDVNRKTQLYILREALRTLNPELRD